MSIHVIVIDTDNPTRILHELEQMRFKSIARHIYEAEIVVKRSCETGGIGGNANSALTHVLHALIPQDEDCGWCLSDEQDAAMSALWQRAYDRFEEVM